MGSTLSGCLGGRGSVTELVMSLFLKNSDVCSRATAPSPAPMFSLNLHLPGNEPESDGQGLQPRPLFSSPGS